ncbi:MULTISPECIES: DUF1995 family protein [Prochlorococcus]|uniref:DUF1995 family protein n=1 Tax=Prochlorococcus TaxID=1218 RepID=UPI000533B44D|nr:MULTISPECIES: DUF1995 family protein [Prochlorococcus]KGG12466.1 hypothetical protein EV05_1678 [Prochlorococcus sp. MIT 0601]
MNLILPQDLKQAETQLYQSTLTYLQKYPRTKFSANLFFEGLKLTPIVIRLANTLLSHDIKPLLLFPDFGSSALAQRDFPTFKSNIITFKDYLSNKNLYQDTNILIAVSPQPYDFEEFSQLCNSIDISILMFNGRLQDTAVGIGSVGRDRKSGFVASWAPSYFLKPLNMGALMYMYPYKWTLFYRSNAGYQYVNSFDKKPNDEEIDTSFNQFLI